MANSRHFAFVILLALAHGDGNPKTTMRTLYKGAVQPPAPGEKFDMSRWLKSAMPAREERCPGLGKDKETTPTDACTVLTVRNEWISYPLSDKKFGSSLKRLDFAVWNITSGDIHLDLHDSEGALVYRIYMRAASTSICLGPQPECLTNEEMTSDVAIVPGRIWVTFSGSEVAVGRGGGDEDGDEKVVGLEDANGSIGIWSTGLYAESAQWHIYSPCA